LNRPAVQAQGDGRWITAFRSVRAWYQGLAYSQGGGHDAIFVLFSVRNKPFKSDARGTWSFGAFGIIKSLDANFDLEGPADINVTGFASPELATQFAASLQSSVPYKIRANPSQTSPVGKLAGGKSAFLFVDGARPFEPCSPGSVASDWNEPISRVLAYFPETPIADLLSGHAQANQKYKIEAEILSGRTGANKEDNSPYGNLTLTDDSVTAELAKANRGGLFGFVPRTQVALAALPVGSRVAAIVDGFLSEGKDKSGASTGEAQWKFNIHVLKPLIDLSAGTAIPSPEQPAVSIGGKKGLDL
jgi:hypothetical protein